MKSFEVTLEYFMIKEGIARAAPGSTRLGQKGPLELLQLLMTFQDISPIQSFVAEPVVTITVKGGGRFMVRTDLHKLILSDMRRPQDPSQILEAASILLEIEDDKKRLRQKLEKQLNQAASQEQQPVPVQSAPRSLIPDLGLSRAYPLLRLAAACLLLIASLRSLHNPAGDVPEPISEAAAMAQLSRPLLGTYATGSKRDDYEIKVLSSKELHFVQYGYTPGRQVRAQYKLGRINGRLCLWVAGFQPIFPEKDSLQMGTLVFRRQ